MIIVIPHFLEFNPATVVGHQLIKNDPGAPGRLVLIVPGFIDGKFFQQVALHQRKLVVTFVTLIYFSIHHRVGQNTTRNRLIRLRNERIHRYYAKGISLAKRRVLFRFELGRSEE